MQQIAGNEAPNQARCFEALPLCLVFRLRHHETLILRHGRSQEVPDECAARGAKCLPNRGVGSCVSTMDHGRFHDVRLKTTTVASDQSPIFKHVKKKL